MFGNSKKFKAVKNSVKKLKIMWGKYGDEKEKTKEKLGIPIKKVEVKTKTIEIQTDIVGEYCNFTPKGAIEAN